MHTEPRLLPDDKLIWCEVYCDIVHESDTPQPNSITDLDGIALKLMIPPKPDGDGHWLLTVEGRFGDCDLVVDGIEVEAEALSPKPPKRVIDGESRSFDVSDGLLRDEALPGSEVLRGDNGIRYCWREAGPKGRPGNWIQLLLPDEQESEDFLDPRAAFCEGDVTEIWTQRRRRNETTYRVKRIDQDRYQLLLDRYPNEEKEPTLFLPVDQRNLFLQKRALRQLAEAPLPHHQGLLRLCENPARVRWPKINPLSADSITWKALTDESRNGTNEQRSFVRKALASKDFAFLEGPPGSGKTTAICEIILQLVEQGQRVLLCASTHVAIDNVLERLLESGSKVFPVRIGKIDKVDDKVQAMQLDARVETLVSAWKEHLDMKKLGDAELVEMAERSIIMASNLTCGTTMGIVNHPHFRGKGEGWHVSERPISTMPHWDVLIVDEASKTLIQEFMVPALMAKRWIVVGDVRQLPPFSDRADIVANLRDLVDVDDKPIFPVDHQRACLILFRLLQNKIRKSGARWLIVEKPGVLEWIALELEANHPPDLSVVRVVAHGYRHSDTIRLVTVDQLRSGSPEALRLAAADWVLVGDDLLRDLADLLPANLLYACDFSRGNGLSENAPLLLRHSWWLAKAGMLRRPYWEKKNRGDQVTTMEDCQTCETEWLERTDLAQELAWRLTRVHELRHSSNERDRNRLRHDLVRLQPKASQVEVKVKEALEEIEDIGLPSILEVLQDGIGVERSTRKSALTEGFRAGNNEDFESRFESLSYQHRMHPEIASFSREVIYEGKSLRDANTIEMRDDKVGWDFGAFPARCVWADVKGRETRGQNLDEVRYIKSVLNDFIDWAKQKGVPHREAPKVWEVACLCFYVKQEQALSKMLQELTQDNRKTRFQVRDAPIEIVCGTVDRFQGREADLVLLSMRNTRRIGFLDSPNRLNVAVTRARQQLVIVGNAGYFKECKISELESLVRYSPLVGDQDIRHRRRPKK
ncbi:MAG: AAA domain-containing protein [Desulfuromonadales bacterium]